MKGFTLLHDTSEQTRLVVTMALGIDKAQDAVALHGKSLRDSPYVQVSRNLVCREIISHLPNRFGHFTQSIAVTFSRCVLLFKTIGQL